VQSERWERLEKLFEQGLKLPQAGRAAWLARACGDDAELRRELEELLRAEATPGVLDAPPLAVDDAHAAAAIVPSLPAGTQLGVWRIEQLVGRGGMGEVYAALRTDAGFKQRGALKLLRFDAIGELARFHAERQILARLEHPNIARLLDGGVAPDGRPYTVLEYVDGVSLLDYCNARHLSLDERLNLFAQVCDAVAYAHRNLIIHRDIKPANTLLDADGKVKLLDFGIAKLVDAVAANNAEATATIAPFTPDYAAPEQLTGEPVTTATDVYALGVLLFELITGERPLRTRGLSSAQALALREREAPLASRVARDNTDAPVSASALAGDLDAIVAKCLRREPAHRYDTVNGLKLDLQRHLAHEPVLAREGARLYVFGRVLRRYRWAAAAAAALILALAAGLAGTLWQARRAQTQAQLAQAQLSRAEATKQFLFGVFKASDPRQASDKPRGGITARELLDASAPRIERDFAAQPKLQIELLGTIAEIFHELKEPERYAALHGRYMDLARQHYGETDPRVIDGYLQEARYAADADDKNTAVQLLDRTDALIRQAALDHSPARARWWVIKSDTLSNDKKQQSDREQLLLRAVDLYEHTQPGEIEYINALIYLGVIYGSDRGDSAKGREFHRRAKAALALLPERDDSEAAIIEFNLALAAANLGDFSDADASYERAANLYLQTYGERDHWYWVTLSQWARSANRFGDRQRADRIFERMESVLPTNPDKEEVYFVGRAKEDHGSTLVRQGRGTEAIPLLEAVERSFTGNPVDLARARQSLGNAYDLTGRHEDARRALKQALDGQLELAAGTGTSDNARLLGARERWGLFLLEHDQTADAEKHLREVIAQDHDRNLLVAAMAHGDMAQLALARAEESVALNESIEALRIADKASDRRDPRAEARLWRLYAQALARNGNLADAHDYAQRAIDAFRRYDDPASAEIGKSVAVLAEIEQLGKR
jgi:tetratricopeptide (TPR) repeat protein